MKAASYPAALAATHPPTPNEWVPNNEGSIPKLRRQLRKTVMTLFRVMYVPFSNVNNGSATASGCTTTSTALAVLAYFIRGGGGCCKLVHPQQPVHGGYCLVARCGSKVTCTIIKPGPIKEPIKARFTPITPSPLAKNFDWSLLHPRSPSHKIKPVPVCPQVPALCHLL